MAETLPLFPLNTVLLPGAALPLHVFESRYRELVVDLLNAEPEERRFGVVGIRQGWEVGEGNVDAMYGIGCSAHLVEAKQLPQGRFDVQATGQHRYRLLDVDIDSASYPVATIEWLPDAFVDPEAELTRRLVDAALSAHGRYRDVAWPQRTLRELDTQCGPAELSYTLAEDAVLSTEDRQELLAEPDPLRRLRQVRKLMLRESRFVQVLSAVPAPLGEFAAWASNN